MAIESIHADHPLAFTGHPLSHLDHPLADKQTNVDSFHSIDYYHSYDDSASDHSNDDESVKSDLCNQSINQSTDHSISIDDSATLSALQAARTPLTIEFEHLSMTLPNGRTILNDVNGRFAHSQLIAIMGGSGCGKSTLLNRLAGRPSIGRWTGTVKVNGVPMDMSQIQSLLGYVPQDDILHPELTVYENLYYSAMLRLPASMNQSDRKQVVDDVIVLLGLEKVRDSPVGSVEKRGVSGGQRKRVNIGYELVANPSLLFMDEPTSGLDACAANEILSAMQRLTSNGLTIITVIHQPRYSIFQAFDTLLMLSPRGQVAYLGDTALATDYFDSLGFALPANENPADFLIDVISGVIKRDAECDSIDNDIDFGKQWLEYEAESSSPPAHLDELPQTLTDRLICLIGTVVDRCVNQSMTAIKWLEGFVGSASSSAAAELDPHFLYKPPASLGLKVPLLHSDSQSINQSFSQVHKQSMKLSSQSINQSAVGIPAIEAGPSLFNQYVLLCRRLMLKLYRNWAYAIVDLVLILILSLTVGFVYGANWTLDTYMPQCVFSCLCMGVSASIASLRMFGSDRLIYWRESLTGVSQTAYFFSLITIELHRVFVYPAIFIMCYLPLAKPHTDASTIYGVFVSVYFFASGFGMLFSVICRPLIALMVASMLLLIMGGFLSGVNPPLSDMSPFLSTLSNLSFTRWSSEALGSAEASFVSPFIPSSNHSISPDEMLYQQFDMINQSNNQTNSEVTDSGLYRPEEVEMWRHHYGFVDRYWTDLAMLIVMGLVMRGLVAVTLRRFAKNHKG